MQLDVVSTVVRITIRTNDASYSVRVLEYSSSVTLDPRNAAEGESKAEVLHRNQD